MSENNHSIGTTVQKRKGYKFPGIIIAKFETTESKVRYVVECIAEGAEGCLHIFNGNQLESYEGDHKL